MQTKKYKKQEPSFMNKGLDMKKTRELEQIFGINFNLKKVTGEA